MMSNTDESQEHAKKVVPRDRLPWAEITESERIERLRIIIKREQQERARMRENLNELREMIMRHRHGDDNTLLVPAGWRNSGSLSCEQANTKPGQEWF